MVLILTTCAIEWESEVLVERVRGMGLLYHGRFMEDETPLEGKSYPPTNRLTMTIRSSFARRQVQHYAFGTQTKEAQLQGG